MQPVAFFAPFGLAVALSETMLPRSTRLRRLLAATLLVAALAGLVLLAREESGRGPVARPGTSPEAKSADGPALTPPGGTTAPVATRAPTTDALATTPAAGEAQVAASSELSPEALRAALARGEPGFDVLASRLEAPPVGITPRWTPGDEWLVETWYRQEQAPSRPWSGPALWRFRVEREVGFRDVPCLQLSVTRADDPTVEPLVLWIGRDSGRLVGSETTVVQQGKAARLLDTPDDGTSAEPAALRAPLTTAPVRLPARGALARAAPPGQTIGDLSGDRLAEAGDTPEGAPAPDELTGAGGAYLDIEFKDPHDGTTVRQRWSDSDLRWPVVSRTATTLSIRRG
jgi:hypothetical protein